MASVLAIDLGLRCGLALMGDDGTLRWHRSHRFGSRDQLKRAVPQILGDIPDLVQIVTEGDVKLAVLWERLATKRGIPSTRVAPEQWRPRLFHPRDRRDGAGAKRSARVLAERVAASSSASLATRPHTDASEAILISVWAALEQGWITEPPRDWNLPSSPG